MKKIMLSFLFIILGLGSFAQSFVIDTTFQPFFDIRSGNDKGYVYDVLELPSGNIFISGTFDFGVPNNQYHRGLTSVTYNGNRNYNYGGSSSGEGFMRFITDTSFMVGHNFFRTKDTNGQTINIPQGINALYTVQCRTGVPYFYKDGSSLVANSISNSGMPCEIINNPDTFPGRHIIKVNPQGLWDSTFVHDATNKEPEAFIPYDSNRIIIYGNPSSFTHYDSVAVNGICRIFLDGRLDTTFNLALNTNQFYNTLNYTIVIPLIEPNGKFFLTGNYYLGNDSIPSNIARFNPDGSIDSSFLFQQGPVDTINNLGGCGSVVKTKDKGYLVGGFFNKYQGYVKKSIAKVDSNGQVQPQYFTSAGPDSTVYGDSFVAVTVIKKAKYGGYYVGGDFLKWDDKASQPIIRITEQQVDVGYNETFEPNYSTEIEIFPNPNNGIFTVRSNSTIRTVKIYTLTGTLIVTENPLRKIFNLNFDAENGIYFAKIELDNGRVISKKIIKN